MMGRTLLVLGWLAAIGLLVAAGFGYQAEAGGAAMTPHILIAFFSSLLLLFAHSWVMFFLIGTGKAIREAVGRLRLDEQIIEETKRYKNESYPWIMAALGTVIATFVLGGGAYAEAIPSWIHHGLFWLTAAVQFKTLVIEGRVLLENDRLMARIDDSASDSMALNESA